MSVDTYPQTHYDFVTSSAAFLGSVLISSTRHPVPTSRDRSLKTLDAEPSSA